MRNACCAVHIVRRFLNRDLQSLEDRIAAQKLIYLVQKVAGLDLGYSFMWYSKGPYSRALAKDLRMEFRECECLTPHQEAIISSLMNLLRESALPLPKALEIAASYLMLKEDVYPKPSDPMRELLMRKPYLKENDVKLVINSLNSYLTSLN
ncbi:MAG: hypothetical protein DRO10_02995 [Thermoprotei archaeon]|nr:MAG: hypothetical protein DRO10_02995 [Thermoprotei archaeon]